MLKLRFVWTTHRITRQEDTVGAKSISPAISISPSATADVLRGQNTFFPKNFFRLPK